MLNGTGPFAELGEEVYDDYWMYYLTKDMARALEIERPYSDLKTYAEYKRRGIGLNISQMERLDQLDTGRPLADETRTEEI